MFFKTIVQEEVARILDVAEAVDAREDAIYGKGKRGDELPEELRFKESRLKKIQEAMGALGQEAEAEERREKIRGQQEAREKQGRVRKG